MKMNFMKTHILKIEIKKPPNMKKMLKLKKAKKLIE